ncbi:type II secretion system F family protein [Paenibacillus thermotolerans]|uniref:type II secretion system F family protein n=1 Tax=Paenibacillus thermotolerans TaxID=3027807 RepID=UPI00236886AB|nr:MULTISPECIES: type II secretion system F family protein [unclassified Paenibacillus]
MLYAAFFITMTLIGYSLYVIPNERKMRIKKRLSFIRSDETAEAESAASAAAKEEIAGTPLWKRLFKAVLVRFRRRFRRKTDERVQQKLEMLILQAGRPFQMTPFEFRFAQLALFLVLPLTGGAYALLLLKSSFGTLLLIIMICLLAAWRLPYLFLSGKVKKRARLALRELPDVLDLLTVSLEAGLGFDSALGKLVSKKGGVLTEEFHRCLEEIRLGRTRKESLIGVRDRLQLDEMRSLVSAILQAEKMGIGMVQVLRVQSAEMRDRRKQRAEEQAMKAPIKMLFPLVIFVFPCLFIVLLGPVLIQFMDTFSNGAP